MRKKKIVLLVTCFLAVMGILERQVSRPSAENSTCGFFPANSLVVASNAQSLSPLTQNDYQDALVQVQKMYNDEFREEQKTLIIQADWNDDRVNSYATRDDDDNPVVVAPGGLARYSLMTKDALLLIFCHEVGHFLGGAPKSPRGQSSLLSWSSAEGEADYFASSRCLKKLFTDEKSNEEALSWASSEHKQELNRQCNSGQLPFQCMRILEAGKIASDVFASVTGFTTMPELTTPDQMITSQTVYVHPSPQCRLDTFVSGVKCAISADVRFDDRDPSIGACSALGARPKCWFVK